MSKSVPTKPKTAKSKTPKPTTKPAASEPAVVESSAPKLHLDSLRIENFRCFRELKIERLARVNLLVGANGSGKTTVLEALRLLAGTRVGTRSR